MFKELFIDKEHICAIGFSAGGHLCGTLATLYDSKDVLSAFGERKVNCRPDAVILSYPVLSAYGKIHEGSIKNISGGDEQIRKKMDIPAMVTENSVPAFIWTTVNDGIVPSESSLLMAMAYREKGVPFELHMFENGCHGLSLAKEETSPPTSNIHVNIPVQAWFDLSVTWLNSHGFTIKEKI